MKKILAMIMMLAFVLSAFAACGKRVNEHGQSPIKGNRYFHVAQKLCDDGTLYSFQYIEYLPARSDCDQYSFSLYNLRYLEQFEKGFPDAYYHDLQLITDQILKERYSPEEILALNPDDFTFEYLDKELVFQLIREGLTGDPEPTITDQNHWDRYDSGFLTEVQPTGGYELQIAYVSESCGVDAFYIDVLYYSEDGSYTQLSDMVDEGTATDEQKQAFEEFTKIIEDCQKNDSYIIDEAYQETMIGGIDFGRLCTFLYNLHYCNWDTMEEHHPTTTPDRLN
ncbi:MAG: hypothetical protein IJW98_08115 [Clostridia bacterium]|nr:hypothetical protein [Clostridia bacterium]